MTVRIGGDTSGLTKAIGDANKEIKSTQKELNEVNKLLKLDPTNTELLKQKQQLLGQQISQTTNKLDALKQKQQAFDEVAKQGGNVSQEEYRKLQREIASTENSLKGLKEEAKNTHPQLEKVGEALKKAGEVAGNALKTGLDLTVKGITAMAGACTTAITAVGGLAIKAGQLADDLNTLSAKTGLSTKQLQEFQYASDLIDVSVETLAGALKKTTTAMASAQDGTGASAEAFKKLGVEVTNADGSLRNNNDVFQEAIRALGEVGNETERDALAMQIFGKSATELNPLIEGGIDTLAKMSEQANELGLILSQEALDGANAFNDQLDILKANGKATFQVIGTEIAGQLAPAMESLNGYVNEVIKSLTTAMKNGGLEGLVKEASTQIGNILTKVTEKLPQVAKLGVDIIITLVNSIKDNAQQIGEAVAEVMTVLTEGFFEVLPDLIETAIVLVTSFIETFANKLPDLLPKIVDGIIGICDAIVNNIDKVIDAGIQLFLGLVDGLAKALPRLIEKLPEVIQKVVTTLLEHLPEIIEAVGTIIITVAQTLAQSIDTLVPAIVECIVGIATTIIDNLPTIITSVIDTVLAIAEAIIDNLDVIIESAVELIIALAEGLVEAIPKLVEKLPEIIMAIVNGLIKLASKLWEVATKLIESLGEGLQNAVSGLGEALSNVWEWIKKTLTDHFLKVADIGKNLVTGIWDGIKNAKDWLIKKIKEWCGSVLDGIKAFFGIESPSKVMADEVGTYMAEGIGVGFERTLPSITKAMTEKLGQVASAMQTELSFGDIPQVQGHTIYTENSYVTKNYTNTVETIRTPQSVELVMDDTTVARALIPALDEEYNRLGVRL